MRLGRAVLSLLLGASLCLAPGTVGAEPNKAPPRAPVTAPKAELRADVLVLHATNSKQGIDARLRELPELTKPPFSAYDSYSVVSHRKLPLAAGSASQLELPNGRVLRTQLLEVLKGDFVRLSASINQPGGDDFLPLLRVKAKLGQRFIVAGQSYKSGILVLVIRVTK
jgi:hypothetical protein